MRKLLIVLAVLAAGTVATSLHAEVLIKEGFEGEQYTPLEHWATNAGEIETHYAGISEDKAASGKRSFKLDVTIPKGHYAYWWLPVDFPFTQPLKFTGKVCAEGEASVELGYAYKNPARGTSGHVFKAKKKKELPAGWSLWEAYEPNFVQSLQLLHMEGLAVYVRPRGGRFANTHVVIYVDDFEVTSLPLRAQPQPAVSKPNIAGHYQVIPIKPITNEKILPSSPVIPASLKLKSMAIIAAQDEFEPASFVILAGKELRDVKVSVSPLKNGDHTISSLDVLAVKCWFRSGGLGPALTSELLLHDDELVRVDVDRCKQQLRATNLEGRTRYYSINRINRSLKPEFIIEDAPALLPVDIPALQPKQFWITVYVPPEGLPGDYQGSIHIEPANAPARTIPMTLSVLPFRLPAPCLEYSHYYRGKLKGDNVPVISSERKTEQQLAAEFRNMKDHGVINPIAYQGGERLERYLQIRERAGLSKERLFTCGYSPYSGGGLSELLAAAKKFGFGEVYVYGPDEASGERLKQQRNAFVNAHKAGLKVFAAVYPYDFFPLVGDILDAPNVHGIDQGEFHPRLAAKVKARGFRMYSYANPQYGQPLPYTYRDHYGLALWKAGYSGAMDYAYQHEGSGHIWNDFDAGFRLIMAYPTSSGVVDTLQWEGFREGVDDVRYVTLLQNLLDEAEQTGVATEKVAGIRIWLKDLDIDGDLQQIRGELCQKILQLREILKP